ncbi:MAG TPA: hypothetical protein VMW72_03090 [Sedimentisphaerales bacterium]|nr:hypothetical protein [Sedimentisphaerales bacterium]
MVGFESKADERFLSAQTTEQGDECLNQVATHPGSPADGSVVLLACFLRGHIATLSPPPCLFCGVRTAGLSSLLCERNTSKTGFFWASFLIGDKYIRVASRLTAFSVAFWPEC